MEHDGDVLEVEEGGDLGEEARHQSPQILVLVHSADHLDQLSNLTLPLATNNLIETKSFKLQLSRHAQHLQDCQCCVAQLDRRRLLFNLLIFATFSWRRVLIWLSYLALNDEGRLMLLDDLQRRLDRLIILIRLLVIWRR